MVTGLLSGGASLVYRFTVVPFLWVLGVLAAISVLWRVLSWLSERWLTVRRPPGSPGCHVVVIGAGFGGLGTAKALLDRGHRVTVVDAGSDVGGTWAVNRYPGAACDIASHLYSFSWMLNPSWAKKWSDQADILEYIRDVVRRCGLQRHIRLRHKVDAARWDPETKQWHVTGQHDDGSAANPQAFEIVADVVVSAVGQLTHPKIPDIPGLEEWRVQGKPVFHSARWDHTVPLKDKRVTVIGAAASALQMVPSIERDATSVALFQRNASYVLERGQLRYPALVRALFRLLPDVMRWYRWSIWLQQEVLWRCLLKGSRLGALVAQSTATYREQQLKADPALLANVTPDSAFGCKRLLVSDDYYQTLLKPHVHLIPDAVTRIHPDTDCVESQGGQRVPTDVLILATGYHTTEFLRGIQVYGTGDRELHDVWDAGVGPTAFWGMSHVGFPNFYTMYGPNTNLGHSSIIFMLECQSNYIAQAVDHIAAAKPGQKVAMHVRPDVFTKHQEYIDASMERTVWSLGCPSWYTLSNGRVVSNAPWSTLYYWWRTFAFNVKDYSFE